MSYLRFRYQIDTSQITLPTNPNMEIPVLDLLRRAVTALESIARSLESQSTIAQNPTPEILDPESPHHQLLAAEVRVQIKRVGYDANDHAKAKELLAALFPGKISLKELTMPELTEYAKKLRQLEIVQRAS